MLITIESTEPESANPNQDELQKSAQEALRLTGLTVDELQEEAKKIRQERFAQDYPDRVNAS